MIAPRWKKILRDLWTNKTRTILVVLSVAVGIFSVGMVTASYSILFRDLNEQYFGANPASATLLTEAFDDDLVRAIRDIPGVEWAEGRRIVSVRVKVGDSEWNDIQLIAIKDFNEVEINKFYSERGARAPAEREMLVERASLELVEARVGDAVTIETPGGELRQLQLTGIVHDITRPQATFSGRGYAYIKFETLEWLGEAADFDQLDFVVAENALDEEYIRNIAAEVEDKIRKSGRTVFTTQIPVPGEHPAARFITPMLLLLGVLGVLALFLSGFLVINTISALLMQQVRQIGVMKAIGARRDQILIMYLTLGFMYGLLALVVGVPLGIVGARFFTEFMAGFINFDIVNFKIPLWVFALEIAIGLVAPFLAALYPIISGTGITVREAITDYGLGRTGGGGIGRFIDRVIERVRGLPRPILLALRNTFRRKGRLALTLITLILAGGTFMAVISLRASLIFTFNEAFTFERYDVEVNFERSYRVAEIERLALEVPGVTAAESWGSTVTRRERPNGTSSENIFLIAPPAETQMIAPVLVEGRWLLPEDENALVVNTELVRKERDVRVGDEIILDVEGREEPWTVVGVIKGVFAPPTAYTNYLYFSQVVREVGQARSVRVATRLHTAGFQTEIGGALEGYFERRGLRVSSTESVAEAQARAQTGANIMVVFMVIMAVLLAVVGGLGLMGTMSINVLERTREIGVLRAIGASDGAVLQVVVVEGVFIGVISWFIAALVAYPLSKSLSDAVGIAFVQAPLSFIFSTEGIILWLVIVVVLTALASFLPARGASKLTVREVLAYE